MTKNKFLKTYKDSELNLLPESFVKYLESKKLQAGEMVKYRLLNGTKNIDPQRALGDDYLFPASVVIHLTDTVKDPDGSIVNIGVVDKFDKDSNPIFKAFHHEPQKGDGGFFFLFGDSIEDIEKFPILELSNKNASNPYRDPSVQAMFERVDDAAESQLRSKKRNYLRDSFNAIDGWSADERKVIGASYNLSTRLTPDELKDKLEEIAEKDPKTFYESIDSENTKVKAIIKLATEAEIISYSPHENKWKYAGSGETIALLDRREGVEPTEQFMEFLKNSANGTKITEQLAKLIKKKNNP